MPHIPKPFSRPSVEIGTHIARRWVDTEAGNLSVGDIVQDNGQVTGISPMSPSSSGLVMIGFFSGESICFFGTDTMRAFTEGAGVGLSE